MPNDLEKRLMLLEQAQREDRESLHEHIQTCEANQTSIEKRLEPYTTGKALNDHSIGELARCIDNIASRLERVEKTLIDERQFLIQDMAAQTRLLRELLRGRLTDEQIDRVARGDRGDDAPTP